MPEKHQMCIRDSPNPLSAAELTLRCEQEMDAMTVLLTDNGYFLLPGGTPISVSYTHLYVMMLDSLKEGNWGPVDLIEVGIDTISIADVKSCFDFTSAIDIVSIPTSIKSTRCV